MPDPIRRYGSFNFVVKLGGGVSPEAHLGGFSDVSGLDVQAAMTGYRKPRGSQDVVRKVAGMQKSAQVTLKRGIVSAKDLWNWLEEAKRAGPAARRPVVISMRDQAGKAVQSWRLQGVLPLKYTGPDLVATGGGDVAMEELVLSAEGFDIEPAN